MTQVIWYIPEIDIYVLETFMDGCEVCFEWDHHDAYYNYEYGKKRNFCCDRREMIRICEL